MFGTIRKKLEDSLREQPSLDSMWLEEPDTKKRYSLNTGHKKTRRNIVVVKNQLLEYMQAREGTPVSNNMLAEAIGYSHQSPASKLVRELIASGHLKKVGGHKGGYIYQVRKSRVNGKRGTKKVAQRATHPNKSSNDGLERVYAYIESHQGQFLTQADIAIAIGCERSAVSRLIQSLVSDGLVERSERTYDGTRYRLPGNTNVPDSADRPNVPVEKPVAPPQPAKIHNDEKLLEVLEPLVWEFIKATRSTDTLVFLTWLEQRSKK